MKLKKLTLLIILLNTSLFAQTITDAIKKTENERFAEATIDFNKLIAANPIDACNFFYAGETTLKKMNSIQL